ncbi:hypothetical protein PACTADRAFT_3159 [Pachysolen tannophilus NRRL Y-2460]|uniref:Uncharacterized protein n=1 Tax=Pachysolen tannophilus NRRL Y-2460 TaxID=669874 RepID=A0A1E4TUR3_PACTA|nr:hypothetical protein PACTADRAFT_3159 [Pachysolen tannophilus NRRL Y-2460]
MAIQKDESLVDPIDHTVTPRIYASKLTPSLSQAALNLLIDYRRTLQSDLNKSIFWSLKMWTIILSTVSIYSYIQLNDYIQYQSFGALIHNSSFIYELVYVGFFFISATVFCFTAGSMFSYFLKKHADDVLTNSKEFFGVDLMKFAALADNVEEFKKTKKQLKKQELEEYLQNLEEGKNTQLIVYREKPIGVIALQPDLEHSNDEQYVVSIKGLSIRRVYADAGLQEDLINWAYSRARELYLNHHNHGVINGKSLKIYFEIFSFETTLQKMLKNLGWKLIESNDLEDGRVAGYFFGVKKQIWGITLNVEPKVEAETEEVKTESKSKNKNLRSRK